MSYQSTNDKPLLPVSSDDTSSRFVKGARMLGMFGAHILVAVILWTSFVYVNHSGMSGGGGLTLDGDDVKVFNAHPLCMLISFVLMTLGRLAFTYETSFERRMIKIFHGMTWLLAICSASIALYAVFASHNSSNGYIANLYSLHSWIGIGVFTLILANFFIGMGSFGLQLVKEEIRAEIMPFHKLVGNVVYFGWAAAILLGIQEKEGFQGCSYTVSEVDSNPVEHYLDIPEVCRISHGLGLEVFAVCICVGLASL